ncbi:small-conductance mechanosensitive channel [Mycetocola sp. CAN_C7]|uniref:Pr6Pr family membrane protein n=1 Tax=Mycetocola sp. CAN_C7 TaxID=2787724 RepID=UPI0018CA6717
MRTVFGVLRIVAAGVILTAIIAQLLHSLTFDLPDVSFFFANFFSFFTIQSNVLAAVSLLVGAWYCFTQPKDPPWFSLALAATVTYMATTGVVYNLLLRQVSLDQVSTLGWSNEILHLVAPIYLMLVWLFSPGRTPVPWNRLGVIVVYPVVWSIYTMLRGALTGWYPYPFLNPAQPGSYGAVVVYILAIASVILLTGAGVVWLSRRRMPAT